MSLINNSTNVLTFSDANTNANFGGYSLTNLGAMKADLSMGTFKITNVVDPVGAQDAATKNYVDTSISNLINGAPGALDTLNELAAALNDDANFSATITNALALKFNTADFNSTFATRYGLTSITSAAAQSGHYSANNYKFTNVADPTSAQDAATKKYVDDGLAALNQSQIVSTTQNTKVVVSDTNHRTTFTNNSVDTMLLDTTSLRPAVPIDLASTYKVVGLADATDRQDAMAFGQDLRHYWYQAALSAALTTGFSEGYAVPFNSTTIPGTLATAVANGISVASGAFTLAPGTYNVTMTLGAQYNTATSLPVSMKLQGSISGASPFLNLVTNRAGALSTQVYTTASTVLTVAAQEVFTMVLTNITYLSQIDRNTKLLVQRVY